MAIYIPFNFNPASRDIKVTNYTIPAGQYAFVQFLAYDTACTIGGDTVIPALTVNDTQTLTASNTNIYTPTTGYDFLGKMAFYQASPFASSTAQEWRIGLRVSGTDYWSLTVSPTSTTVANVSGAHAHTGTVNYNSTNGLSGIMDWEAPSAVATSFAQIVGSNLSVRVHIFGSLKMPIGAQYGFWVNTGVEVIGSSFEVTLYNEA